MSAPALSFVHRFEPAVRPGPPPVLLLHGTGGDETDLIPLGRTVAPGAALLSPRGKVLEGGMPRFFRRLAEGVFDEDDLRRRADELAGFVDQARKAYGLSAPVALGFSNGANIAAAMLLLRPDAFAGAILIRAMEPFREASPVRLPGTPVLILSGSADPIVPIDNPKRLAATLAAAGAAVEHEILPGGHALIQADLVRSRAWMDRLAAG
ncbi:alpha/beta hydrolase [Enterovirga aerilata]|uniref:Alpha/beta hydrolase n=1 Tax=Enterovirga aerilata TaxID=2730920 RepID=A0A849HW90_9HYPH|nr:alpha/beta hydrolase [Enterovirga sp. DB1703]NNM71806.1 alpha/beta hydrolase [Enterovirga sp. DB1703]